MRRRLRSHQFSVKRPQLTVLAPCAMLYTQLVAALGTQIPPPQLRGVYIGVGGTEYIEGQFHWDKAMRFIRLAFLLGTPKNSLTDCVVRRYTIWAGAHAKLAFYLYIVQSYPGRGIPERLVGVGERFTQS